VHTLLKSNETGRLDREGLKEAIRAATNAPVDAGLLDTLWRDFGCEGSGVTTEGIQDILVSGRLSPAHHGRLWVAVSLAEAETLRRVLHLRKCRQAPYGAGTTLGQGSELALHISQSGALGLPGSTILDTSSGWQGSTGSTYHELAVALGCYRFFDCDMHYTRPTLTRIIRALQKASCHDREEFFASTVGSRRRMERKWQETPLAAVFSIADEWVSIKQNAQAAFVRTALKRRQMTPWEAFVAFDADNNSKLSPSELYGALRWLEVPELTAEDVVDFFEHADTNRDGMIEYAEYMSLFEVDGKPLSGADGEATLSIAEVGDEEEEEEDDDDDRADGEGLRAREPPPKIDPFGADELRNIMVRRRRLEIERQREELARRTAQQADLDIKLFREELQASARRKGGSNPRIYLSTADDSVLTLYSSTAQRLVVFSFTSTQLPLRASVRGKSKYVPVLIDEVRKNLQAPKCNNGHTLSGTMGTRWGRCGVCDSFSDSKRWCFRRDCYYFVCKRCDKAHEDEQVRARSDPAGKHTFIQCEMGSDLTLHIPPSSVDPAAVDSTSSPAPALSSLEAAHVAQGLVPGEPLSAGAAGELFSEQQGSVSLQSPLPLSDDFAVTMELRLQSLPSRGQLAALARFNSPDASQARRRHMSSFYCDSEGNVGHSLTPTEPVSNKAKWQQQQDSEGGGLMRGGGENDTCSPSRSAGGAAAADKSGEKAAETTTSNESATKEAASNETATKEAAKTLRLCEGRWMVLTVSVQVTSTC
jgi:hypothetical protein